MKRAAVPDIFIKNSLLIALASIISISTSLCNAGDHITPKTPSQLRFGARVDAAPFSYKEGEIWRGYSIDICRRIYETYQEDYANYPGIQKSNAIQQQVKQVEFVPVPAPERMEYFKNDQIDILCGATTVTIDRMKYVDFTLFTFVTGTSIMKKRGTDSSNLFDFKVNKEKKADITYVGCTNDQNFIDCSTTEDWIVKRFGSAIERKPKHSHTEAFNALNTGEAKFYIGDRVLLENKLRTSSHANDFELAPIFLTFEPYAIAIAKGNDLLLYSANSTLAKLYRNADAGDGINKIYYNYFPNEQSEMLKNMYQLQALSE